MVSCSDARALTAASADCDERLRTRRKPNVIKLVGVILFISIDLTHMLFSVEK